MLALEPRWFRFSSTGVWTSGGPAGESLMPWQLTPTDPTLYAEISASGVFKNTNGGTNSTCRQPPDSGPVALFPWPLIRLLPPRGRQLPYVPLWITSQHRDGDAAENLGSGC
jgi:hypothetical protein